MKDLLGRTFDFATPPSRVVSLVPSLTETLFDLGAGDAVAGITDFCIFPEGLDRPRVGGTKNPRIDEIRALAPDLVYMNLEENLERHAKQIEEFAPVFVTEPKTVDDVAALIATLGAIHRRDERARELTEELAQRARSPSRRSRSRFRSGRSRGCGAAATRTFRISSSRSAARTCCAIANAIRRSTLEEVLALRPDVVFLPDEPYVFTADDAAEIRGPRVIGRSPAISSRGTERGRSSGCVSARCF